MDPDPGDGPARRTPGRHQAAALQWALRVNGRSRFTATGRSVRSRASRRFRLKDSGAGHAESPQASGFGDGEFWSCDPAGHPGLDDR